MFLRRSTLQPNDSQAVLEREQLTLANVQIDSWLLQTEPATFERVLRMVVAKYAWRRPEALELSSSECGRIYLRDDVLGRPLYLSAACSASACAVIISREPRIGIQIVSPQEADALIPEIEGTICAQERDLLASLTPPARRRALLSMWTRKRALQQANAVTSLAPLQSIAVGLGELALELPDSFGWLDRWRVYGFSMRSGELGSIAVYSHDQFLGLGAGDRRANVKKGTFAGNERRH
jgi:phosphopantetheinyl transferase